MVNDFERAHAFTRRWEGGKIDHPSDPGGRTAYGVTQGVYDRYRADHRLPRRDVWLITEGEVLDIYRTRYWQPYAAALPWPLSAVAYDIAVNHGPKNLRYMLSATSDRLSPADRAAALIQARERFYRSIVANRPSQGVFLNGWLNRALAQRQWLASQMPTQRLLLVPMGGGEPKPWNGRDSPFGGIPLGDALTAELDLIYPAPGGPWVYLDALNVWRRRDGNFVLERRTK